MGVFRSRSHEELDLMNWEIVGVTAEIVGAIGGVVSLVYLAIQVRLAGIRD